MEVKSILCDAATVREGLLHILGGGITRLWRPEYPAAFTGALAVMIHPHQTEVDIQHRLVIRIAGADGSIIAKLEGDFSLNRPADLVPGEQLAIPIVFSFANPGPLEIPAAGSYSIDVLVDQQHKDSLSFEARQGVPPGQSEE